MEPTNKRRFRVKGKIECGFTPNDTTSYSTIPNVYVEAWQKSPMEVILLGKASTDTNGDFLINVEIDGNAPYIEDGKINNVFLKIYYNNVLITGGNPYL